MIKINRNSYKVHHFLRVYDSKIVFQVKLTYCIVPKDDQNKLNFSNFDHFLEVYDPEVATSPFSRSILSGYYVKAMSWKCLEQFIFMNITLVIISCKNHKWCPRIPLPLWGHEHRLPGPNNGIRGIKRLHWILLTRIVISNPFPRSPDKQDFLFLSPIVIIYQNA